MKKKIVGEDGKEYYIKEKKPFYKRIWFILLAIFVGLGIIGAVFGDGTDVTTSPAQNNTETPIVEDYEITEVSVVEDDFLYSIEGILKNNTDKEKSYVQITVPIYDTEGNKLGDCIDNINNLGAGKTWKFKASYLGEKLEGMTANLEEIEVTGF